MTIKYPHVNVQLAGDGNAFTIIGRVTMAMKAAGIPDDEIEAYRKESTSGDYNKLLRVTFQTVNTSDVFWRNPAYPE